MHALQMFSTAALLALAPAVALAQADGQALAHSLQVKPLVLTPGSEASIQFQLAAPADVTLRIEDADHFPVALVADAQPLPQGSHSLSWNGRDDAGNAVPNGAYNIVIEARGEDGSTAIEPARNSGGERLTMLPVNVDRDAGMLRVSLNQPARIRVRAGVHDGPLCATVLDWRALPAGDHAFPWDGRDASGAGVFWDHARFNLVVDAHSLPEPCIIVTGSNANYMDYWRGRARAAGQELAPYRLASEAAQAARNKLRQIQAARMQAASGNKLSRDYFGNRFFDQTPELRVSAPAQAQSGNKIEIDVALDEATAELLAEKRYEYVLYVDYVRQAEREIGYTPYTWEFDTSGLTIGDHVITVNVATLDGQVGAAASAMRVEP